MWWSAWYFYSSGEYKKAEQALQNLIRLHPRSILVSQARYWQGRAAEKRDEPAQASAYYNHLLKRAPYTYYGYRAADRLAQLKFGDVAVPVDLPGDSAAECVESPCPGEPPVFSESDDGPPVWTDEAKQLLSADAVV